ncbi:MAG: hypothetical protein GXY66_08115 [Bacteroidales bacterium]|nr:hypothetical protein [Bacteroidales bacterium]
MKKHQSILILSLLSLTLAFTACGDAWDNHYGKQTPVADGNVEIYPGSLKEFLASAPEFSTQNALFADAGIYDKMLPGQEYTILLYPDNILDTTSYAQDNSYAAYCICDIALSPADMEEGMGISTWYGKNLWISLQGEQIKINDCPVEAITRTNNAFVYRINEKVIPVRLSVYDVINGLDDARYSKFKSLIRMYERRYFDPAKCTPAGTNEQGNTIYSDSVKGWSTKNILMDRYSKDGQEMWNMRNEYYNSTVFIPDNDIIQAAVDTALARVPLWLGRTATAADRNKFEKWIIRACFVDRLLNAGQVTGSEDIDCVGGYQKDSLEGKTVFEADMAMWRPRVQKVRTGDMISASNGNIFFVDWLKIPNNVVIYRLKSRFYELWNNMNQEQRDKYFRWDHWIDPMVLNDAQSSFTLSETMPTMYYHVLTAIPDKDARRDSLVCSVTYDGVLFNQNNPRGSQIRECHIPAGEYYLRMGFKHSLLYSLSIQFCDTLLVEDMVMYAQGSNFHFDRGSVSVVDNYGESSIGYPEGYNWHDWSSLSEKAQAYDTDGYPVGIVNMKEDGNFTITISSSDMSYLYTYGADRNTHNISQLMMYHWCLRPTKNNY